MSRAARLARAPRQPTAAEMFYTRALLGILRDQQSVIRLAMRTPDNERTDAPSSPIAIAIARLRAHFVDLLTEEHLASLLDKVVDRVDKHAAEETARLIGIRIEDVPELRTLAERFRRENVALIRSVAIEQLDRVSNVVEVAQSSGTRVEDLAGQVQEQFGVSESRASLIARDQVLKANGDLTQARHERAGITEYTWTTAGDARVRDGHAKLDGKRFSYANPPVTDASGARNAPGRDFQCRCTPDPVIDALL